MAVRFALTFLSMLNAAAFAAWVVFP